MIMANNYPWAVPNNRRSIYLSRTQDRTIDRPLVPADILHHLIFRIKHQNAHLLVIQKSHLHHEEVPILSSDGETHHVTLSGQVPSYSTPSHSQISLSLRESSICSEDVFPHERFRDSPGPCFARARMADQLRCGRRSRITARSATGYSSLRIASSSSDQSPPLLHLRQI